MAPGESHDLASAFQGEIERPVEASDRLLGDSNGHDVFLFAPRNPDMIASRLVFGGFVNKNWQSLSHTRRSPSNGFTIEPTADSALSVENEKQRKINPIQTGSIRSFVETVSQ